MGLREVDVDLADEDAGQVRERERGEPAGTKRLEVPSRGEESENHAPMKMPSWQWGPPYRATTKYWFKYDLCPVYRRTHIRTHGKSNDD